MVVVGIALFAFGILVSLGLHEAGHALAARAFGMRVTRFFVGYGRTLFSFRRREIEYGVKAIPAGAFVTIVGMVRQDSTDPETDDPKAMWRFPVWKRTAVMAAGIGANVLFGIVLLWGVFAFVPLPDSHGLQTEPVTLAAVSECVETTFSVDAATGRQNACRPGADPASAASRLGLRPGDVITTIDGRPVRGWDTVADRVHAAGGRTITVGYERDGRARTGSVPVPVAEQVRPEVLADPKRTASSITADDLERVGVLGITPRIPESTAGPVGAIGLTTRQTTAMIGGTFSSLAHLPQRIPALWASLTGGERQTDSPVSLVGASHLGGQLADRGQWASFVLLLAGLNFFLAAFNLLPLLPLDGGHLAIMWFERARSWIWARLRRPDPGFVDYYKLAPLTYVAILLFAAFTLLTVAADVVNPIAI
ncbi:M50 family metallopeptidase [Cryptosporangium sp. NPDC051539]|uniref:M50 family metallopeptidase n=1 Tax=Cryptosporangium sp. NPDC051539 TaxID=3363962 RepID=UPI0037B8948A